MISHSYQVLNSYKYHLCRSQCPPPGSGIIWNRTQDARWLMLVCPPPTPRRACHDVFEKPKGKCRERFAPKGQSKSDIKLSPKATPGMKSNKTKPLERPFRWSEQPEVEKKKTKAIADAGNHSMMKIQTRKERKWKKNNPDYHPCALVEVVKMSV